MMRQIRIANHRSDLHAAAGCCLHLGQGQVRDVDQRLRPFDVELHQVDERRPAGDVADVGALLSRLGATGEGDRVGAVLART